MNRSVFLVVLAVAGFGVAFGVTKLAHREPTPPTGMVWIAGGEFTMGTDAPIGWPDEKPAHRVRVDGFFIDATEVTNAQFRKFVEEKKYVTTAEKPPVLEEIMAQSPPGTKPPAKEELVAGSLVFKMTPGPVDTRDFSQWWRWTPGADWRRPDGPGSNIDGKDDHPVVQRLVGRRGRFCEMGRQAVADGSRVGVRGSRRTGQQTIHVGGRKAGGERKWQTNIWQGQFPYKNTAEDGFERTAPAKSFPANGYGLFDMSGNVWEWCSDWYQRDLYRTRAGKLTVNPKGPESSNDPQHPFEPRRVQKGGSFLCNDSYCSRYRPSARHSSTPDSGMSHVGFRCVLTP